MPVGEGNFRNLQPDDSSRAGRRKSPNLELSGIFIVIGGTVHLDPPEVVSEMNDTVNIPKAETWK